MKVSESADLKMQFRTEADAELKALVIYEDKPAGIRAERMLDRVLIRLKLQEQCELVLCRLDLLDWLQARREVARSAVVADIVLVSMRGDKELHPAIGAWLNLWSALQTKKPQVLGLLLEQSHGQAMDLALRFYRFALNKGMEIFLSWPDRGSRSRQDEGVDRTATVMPTLGSLRHERILEAIGT